MKIHNRLLVVLVILISNNGFCKTTEPVAVNDSFFQQDCSHSSLKIMTYNLHNLFDTEHDQGHFDYTFLPQKFPDKVENCNKIGSRFYRNLCLKLDWVPQRMEQKLRQISRAIKSHGDLPDILAVQEIENEHAIASLAKKLGYDEYLITNQSSTRRGIDVGVLWNEDKLQFVGHREVKSRLRSPLRVHFQVRETQQDLYIYINHWPAQSAPTSWRTTSAKAVRHDINQLSIREPQARVIVLGDFNTVAKEESSVIEKNLLGEPSESSLVDIHDLSRQVFPEYRKNFPDGTYWRHSEKKWNRFDRIFISKNLIDGPLQADISSYRIIYSEFLTGYRTFHRKGDKHETRVRYPLAYKFLEKEPSQLGFSDHLPVSIILNY